jgi:hypothetical protein
VPLHPRTSQVVGALERDHQLVWTFDFVLGLQEFFTPWLARALGALVDHAANGKTVIAGSFGARARELLTCLAGLEELVFERSVFAPQFALTHDAHNLLLTAHPLNITPSAFFYFPNENRYRSIAGIHPKTEKATLISERGLILTAAMA